MTEVSTRRIALVTGGSRGIGRAVAIALAESGHKVAVNYASNEAAAEEVVSRITDGGGEAIALQADVRDAGAVDEMFSTIEAKLGSPLILVN
ncbi:MAG TPA: SDR family NAD(P)-dependent oxidoreductase, partial [Acidimicrobiia bacterium]|nr:SDR family NAD(P)-dependent oxidoreductase [Acidimicrobiia bacterium]